MKCRQSLQILLWISIVYGVALEYIPKSCQEKLRGNNLPNGLYKIQPDVSLPPIKVHCARLNNGYQTSISHNSPGVLYVHGYESCDGKKGWHHKFQYENIKSVIAVVQQSDECKQYGYAQSYDADVDYNKANVCLFAEGRSGNKIPYWAGGNPTCYCKCCKTKSCHNKKLECNAESNDRVPRVDDGFYTDKSYLPITGVYSGDTGTWFEWRNIKIGDLICSSEHFPKSCQEKLQGNNLPDGRYKIQPDVGLSPIHVHCARLKNAYQTSISHTNPGTHYVHGYESCDGKKGWHQKFQYENIKSAIAVVQQSHECKQYGYAQSYGALVNYNKAKTCLFAEGRSGNKIPYWAGGNPTCYCKCCKTKSCHDKKLECNAESNDKAVRVDDGFYTDKSYLPITGVYSGDTGDSYEWRNVKVGDLICLSKHYPKSCQEKLQGNNLPDGRYKIQPDVTLPPIHVHCARKKHGYQTSISSNSPSVLYVHGYESCDGKTGWHHKFQYENIKSTIAVVQQSHECKQYGYAQSHGALVNYNKAKTCLFAEDRSGNKIPYWAGGNPTSYCKCGITKSCHNKKYECNAQSNDKVARVDDGFFTDESYLPITGVYSGDTGDSSEWRKVKIGDLICFNYGCSGQ